MANAKHHQAKRLGDMRNQAKAAEASAGPASDRAGGSKGNAGIDETATAPAAVGGTIFKIPLGTENTNTFRRVPRAFFTRYEEKDRVRNPPVGGYRPKHEYLAPKIKGAIPYDSFTNVGVEQAGRIRAGQFEEYSKLCMCILKALDQEQVDLNQNPKLKS